MFNLIKKDFLIVKTYLPLTVILAFAIPLFIWWKAPVVTGFTSFIITVIFTVYVPLQSVSLAEERYPRTSALLCTAPYQRSTIIKARYVFFLILYIFCYLAYTVLCLFIPGIEMISASNSLLSFLVFSIILGIYLPLQYKLGFEKTKYALIIVLWATSFCLPSLVKVISKTDTVFGILTDLPSPVTCAALTALIIIVVAMSLTASISIFQTKEL